MQCRECHRPLNADPRLVEAAYQEYAAGRDYALGDTVRAEKRERYATELQVTVAEEMRTQEAPRQAYYVEESCLSCKWRSHIGSCCACDPGQWRPAKFLTPVPTPPSQAGNVPVPCATIALERVKARLRHMLALDISECEFCTRESLRIIAEEEARTSPTEPCTNDVEAEVAGAKDCYPKSLEHGYPRGFAVDDAQTIRDREDYAQAGESA